MNAIARRAGALKGEQVEFLYRHLPTSLLINALLGAILVAVQGRVVPAHLRFGWLAAFCVVLLVRAALLVLWRKADSSAAYDARRWLNRLRITTSATGVAWVSAAFSCPLPGMSSIRSMWPSCWAVCAPAPSFPWRPTVFPSRDFCCRRWFPSLRISPSAAANALSEFEAMQRIRKGGPPRTFPPTRRCCLPKRAVVRGTRTMSVSRMLNRLAGL